jgi:hypothetical protein
MSATDRPEQTLDDGVLAEEKPACVALVPLVTSAQWSQIPSLSPSNSIFVTHLIATAEHVPQTRSLRRGTAADARTAYQSVTHHNDVGASGLRTRQTI